MNCLSCVNLSKMLASFTINLWIKFNKFLKLSLIVKFIKHDLSTASLQCSTGKVIYHFTCRRLQIGSRNAHQAFLKFMAIGQHISTNQTFIFIGPNYLKFQICLIQIQLKEVAQRIHDTELQAELNLCMIYSLCQKYSLGIWCIFIFSLFVKKPSS